MKPITDPYELMDVAKLGDNEFSTIPVFEIEVTDKEGQTDYVTCWITTKSDQLIAHRNAVSKSEEVSIYVAKTVVDIDDCFSLDEYLQDLFAEVNNDIVAGDLYNLA